MTEIESLLLAGDWHGDPQHAMWCFQKALNENVDAIFQVGDFGFWEHIRGAGSAFLDMVSNLATENGIPCFWIDGNHESHTILRATYGPDGRLYDPTPEGFWTIRPGLYYVPRGTRWTWKGKRFMGLGGAYSVDKAYRLAREQGKACPQWGWTWEHARANPATGPGTMWWPEEEITDEEVAFALRDTTPLDVIFTHDKPRASSPGWNRKDLPECAPNQDKIQTVINTLKPRVLVHGHLHHPYKQEIMVGDDAYCLVVSLHCNPDDPQQTKAQKREQREASVEVMRL